MRKKLVIHIEVELTPRGAAAAAANPKQYQKMADDMAAFFQRDPINIKGSKVNVELRP